MRGRGGVQYRDCAACSDGGGLDAYASALVADAYAVGTSDAGRSRSPSRAHSTPEPDDDNAEPGHRTDPPDPRRGHRPKPTEPLPLEVPPIPKLRPLE